MIWWRLCKACLNELQKKNFAAKKQQQQQQLQQNKKQMQEERFKQKMDEEHKVEDTKLEIKKRIEEKKDILVNRENRDQVKLRKLVIKKFEGISLD